MAQLSIVIPVYNVSNEVLKRSVFSVINQTLRDIEIIIVDDGSNNECAEVCDIFANNDDRVYVLHQNNRGLSAARNAGVKKVSSPWFMFMDGDDWLEVDACENVMREVEDSLDICIFGINRDVGSVSNRIPMIFFRKEIYEGDECKKLRSLVLDQGSFISTAYAKVYRTKFIAELGLLHDEQLKSGIEGIEYCYRVFNEAEKIKTIGYYGYHYVYVEDSLSSSPSEQSNYLILLGLHKLYEYIKFREECLEDISSLYIRAAYVIMATATRSYFNIRNKYRFSERKEKMNSFLEDNLIDESICFVKHNKVKMKKKYLFTMITNHFYFGVYIYSWASLMRYRFRSN